VSEIRPGVIALSAAPCVWGNAPQHRDAMRTLREPRGATLAGFCPPGGRRAAPKVRKRRN